LKNQFNSKATIHNKSNNLAIKQDFANIILAQSKFENNQDKEKLVDIFIKLYRIEIFKDGLDLILSKLKEKKLQFEIRLIKGWDTNQGCFLTQKRSFIDKAVEKIDKIFYRQELKIIIRNLSYNVLAHEMAHCFEFESGISLNEKFREAIALDMNGREADFLPLKSQIKRLMVDALKNYKPEQFLSELFARYFELLSISRNVCQNGDFQTQEVMNFFINTTNFIDKIFNPSIKKQINIDIADKSSLLIEQIKFDVNEKKFQENFHSNAKKSELKKWTGSINSNAKWLNDWKKSSKD